VPISTNSKGWWDVEHHYQKEEGVFRILILGDSLMTPFGVHLEETYSRQLESILSEAGWTEIEVINLSVIGYGTLQEYLAFMEEGVQYQPDIVILAFYGANDLPDNSYNIQVARYGEDDIHIVRRPFLEPDDLDQWNILLPDINRCNEIEAETPWWQKTALYAVTRDPLLHMRNDVAVDPHLALTFYSCSESPKFNEAWDVTESIIAALNNEVVASGAELIVVNVPSMMMIESYVNDADGYFLGKDLCLEAHLSRERLSRILDNHDIPALDLTDLFYETSSREDLELYYSFDRHWNAAGHFLAAQLTYQMLNHEGYLPPP
jgi:hypothetical protein